MSYEMALPWENEPWFVNSPYRLEHDPRRSENDPALIAYWQSPEKKERGIRTPIKPGRYLVKFFCHLTDNEVKLWVQRFAGQESIDAAWNPTLMFADTKEAIQDVYERGPASCMSHKPIHFDSRDEDGNYVHPCVVYESPDIKIAYILAKPGATMPVYAARAIVHPKRKVYGRVYPTEGRYEGYDGQESLMEARETMFRVLYEAGYKAADHDFDAESFDGARLTRIDAESGGIILPYLDSGYNVNECDSSYVTMTQGDGDYTGQETCGVVFSRDDDARYSCARCGDRIHQDDTYMVSGDVWCESCYSDRAFHCESCEETYDIGYVDSVRVNYRYRGRSYSSFSSPTFDTQTWCESCARNNAFRCEGSDEWYRDGDMQTVDIDGETYSVDWAVDNAYQCAVSGEWFLNDSDGETVIYDGELQWVCNDIIDEFGTFRCAVSGRKTLNTDVSMFHPNIGSHYVDDPNQHCLPF